MAGDYGLLGDPNIITALGLLGARRGEMPEILMRGFAAAEGQKRTKAEEQLRALQMQQMQAAMERQRRQDAMQEREDALVPQFARPAVNPLTPNDDMGNAMPVKPAMFDRAGYAQALEGVNPQRALQYQAQLAGMNQKESFTLKPGERRYQGEKVVAEGSPDVNQMIVPGPDGKPMLNPLYVQGKKEIAAAGRQTTNVNLPPAQKAFEVELAKLDAKQLDDMRDSAMKAQNGLSRLAEMKRLAQEGTYSGWGAQGRAGVANFFNTLGVPMDPKKLENSQEYLKHARELTLSMLKEGVGSQNISNADLKFVNETVPQLETNPQARMNLLNYMEQRLGTSVQRFQAADSYARERGGLSGFDYGAKKPAAPKLQRNQTALYKAREAIKQGKDPAAVRQRLIDSGFDPEGL